MTGLDVADVDVASARELADGIDRAVGEVAEIDRRRHPMGLAKAIEELPERIDEPRVAPAGAFAAGRSLEEDDPGPGIATANRQCRPEPRISAADDGDVGPELAGEGRGRLDLPRLGQPPPAGVMTEGGRECEAVARNIGTPFRNTTAMSGARISIEEDPTPLARAIAVELGRRLEDPEFAASTSKLRGSVAVRVGPGPEAATIELGDGLYVGHGEGGSAVTATLDRYGRWDGGPIPGEEEHPDLARWLRDLTAPPPSSWRDAAARLWAELGPAPGAPPALLVIELDSGERERFGDDGRAYEIRARAEPLLALLEGRSSLLEEASAGRVQILGSFPEISVISGACARIRMGSGVEGA